MKGALRVFLRRASTRRLGPSLDGAHRALAAVIDRLLRGANPAELAVAGPTTYVFALNLEMARRLKLVVPEHVLKLTTEVIG